MCEKRQGTGITITAVRTSRRLIIVIEHIKTMQIPYLEIWSMLISGQSSSQEQFKALVLESQRPCPSSNTVIYEESNLPPITDWLFFHKQIQGVGHNMLHLDM